MSDGLNDPMVEQVEEYVLGLLDGEELASFEARLATDATFARRVQATRAALTDFALSTPAMVPKDLKERVMAHAVRQPDAPTRAPVTPIRADRPSRAPLWLGLGLAASLGLLAVQSLDLNREREATAAAEALAAKTAATLAEREALLARLTDPGVELVTLASTGAAKPTVRVYLDTVRRSALLTIASLDAAPAGKVYQLWFIVDGTPVPSVTFQTDAQGRALIEQVTLPTGTVAAGAVTMEPTGGSTAPTMPILFVGSVKSE
ncbi:MAG: anti-sigma factor [Gemmatimonadales bacterium]